MDKYIKARFNIENIFVENYEGYNKILGNRYCENWNGWACPCFEKDVVEKLLNEEEMQLAYTSSYDSENDTFKLVPNKCFGDVEDFEEYQGFDIIHDGKLVHVYGIGAFAWCWDVE